ncbi:MAG: glycosyltransferase family 4 protein [Candidatus Spechtbacteria bacterium]|nr:glycosyltransferase family 4 protein [Candidatus Spechtbacteria bacterium]
MKLLIVTQKVDRNDDNLGFFHTWIEKFSSSVEKLYVVCLAKGEYELPSNVEVYSMGKERGASKIVELLKLEFYLWKHLSDVDGVFIHMAPMYAIASFPLVRLRKKRMILWYTHRSQNWKVSLAEKMVQRVLTASRESFRTKSKKVKILGHGVDTEMFQARARFSDDVFRILYAGRISAIKDLETLVAAIDILSRTLCDTAFKVSILGRPLTPADVLYFKKMKEMIVRLGVEQYISFLGSVPHASIAPYYQKHDILINLCPTGGMDKVVLEAMSCGMLVTVSNETFRDLMSIDAHTCFEAGNPRDLARKIVYFAGLSREKRQELGVRLRDVVVKKHNLDTLVRNIISEYNTSHIS